MSDCHYQGKNFDDAYVCNHPQSELGYCDMSDCSLTKCGFDRTIKSLRKDGIYCHQCGMGVLRVLRGIDCPYRELMERYRALKKQDYICPECKFYTKTLSPRGEFCLYPGHRELTTTKVNFCEHFEKGGFDGRQLFAE